MSSKFDQGPKQLESKPQKWTLSCCQQRQSLFIKIKENQKWLHLKHQKGPGSLGTRPISRVVGKSVLGVGFRGKILDLLLNPTCLQRNLDPFILPFPSPSKKHSNCVTPSYRKLFSVYTPPFLMSQPQHLFSSCLSNPYKVKTAVSILWEVWEHLLWPGTFRRQESVCECLSLLGALH